MTIVVNPLHGSKMFKQDNDKRSSDAETTQQRCESALNTMTVRDIRQLVKDIEDELAKAR